MVKWVKKPLPKRGDRILEEKRKRKMYESNVDIEDYVSRDKHNHILKIHLVDFLDALARERLDILLKNDEYYRNRINDLEMMLRLREDELQVSRKIIAEAEDKRVKRSDEDIYKPSKKPMRLIGSKRLIR